MCEFANIEQLMPTSQLRLDHYPTCLGAIVLRKLNIVAYAPIMLERAVAIALDCRVVNIDILAIIARDEAIATLVVKPFYLATHILYGYNSHNKVTQFILPNNTTNAIFSVLFVDSQNFYYICGDCIQLKKRDIL